MEFSSGAKLKTEMPRIRSEMPLMASVRLSFPALRRGKTEIISAHILQSCGFEAAREIKIIRD